MIDQDAVVPEEYTTYFRSVIVFGKVRVLYDESEKRNALEILAARYSTDHEQGRLQEIEKQFNHVCLIELSVEYISGKEAIEHVKAKIKLETKQF